MGLPVTPRQFWGCPIPFRAIPLPFLQYVAALAATYLQQNLVLATLGLVTLG